MPGPETGRESVLLSRVLRSEVIGHESMVEKNLEMSVMTPPDSRTLQTALFSLIGLSSRISLGNVSFVFGGRRQSHW